MNKIKNFTDLEAWKKSFELSLLVYKITQDFPKHELFGLTSQMRRCGVSIPSNIAEGFSRKSSKQKVYFYSNSKASLSELQTQLLISRGVKYLEKDKFNDIISKCDKVSRLLTGLIRSQE